MQSTSIKIPWLVLKSGVGGSYRMRGVGVGRCGAWGGGVREGDWYFWRCCCDDGIMYWFLCGLDFDGVAVSVCDVLRTGRFWNMFA